MQQEEGNPSPELCEASGMPDMVLIHKAETWRVASCKVALRCAKGTMPKLDTVHVASEDVVGVILSSTAMSILWIQQSSSCSVAQWYTRAEHTQGPGFHPQHCPKAISP